MWSAVVEELIVLFTLFYKIVKVFSPLQSIKFLPVGPVRALHLAVLLWAGGSVEPVDYTALFTGHDWYHQT